MAESTEGSESKMVEVNCELLISLVGERPVLWDKTIEQYKDKRRTFEAWREIFTILNKDFEKMGNTEKNEYGHLVMKKWTALRDCWMKSHRRLKTWKPGSGMRPCRKYIYYDDMIFLSKIATRWNPDSNDNTANEDDESEKLLAKSRKRKEIANTKMKTRAEKESRLSEENEGSTNEMVASGAEEEMTVTSDQIVTATHSTVDPRMLQVRLVENQEDSRAMAFFRGLAPIVDKFTDEEIVDFQYEVIKAARTIQKRRNISTVSVQFDDSLDYKPNVADLQGSY